MTKLFSFMICALIYYPIAINSMQNLDTDLLQATRSGDAVYVNDLLNRGAHVNTKGNNDFTPLHIAAMYGRRDVVQVLLHRPAADVNAKDSCGRTPLHTAAMYGHTDIVQILLNTSGVNAHATDNYGHTSLHTATIYSHIEVVQVLSYILDINAKDNKGRTPLHLAIRNGNIKIVQALLDISNIDINAQDISAQTPLHAAARYCRTRIVNILLNNNGIKVNGNKNDGWATFLISLIDGCNSIEAVKKFCSATGITAYVKDNYDATPLYLAFKHGHKAVVQLLQDQIRRDQLSIQETLTLAAAIHPRCGAGSPFLATAAVVFDSNFFKNIFELLRHANRHS